MKNAAKATVAVQQFYLAIVKGPGISRMRSDETCDFENLTFISNTVQKIIIYMNQMIAYIWDFHNKGLKDTKQLGKTQKPRT